MKALQNVPPHNFIPAHMDRLFRQSYIYLRRFLPEEKADFLWLEGQKIQSLEQRILYYTQVVAEIERRLHGNQLQEYTRKVPPLEDYTRYKETPVTIEQFLDDPYYLNRGNKPVNETVYPELRKHLVEVNSGKYVELVATGGIGSGKTTLALYTTIYQTYLLSLMRDPHTMFGLDAASEIIIIFQSISEKLAKGVDYNRFRSMVQTCPYFREKFPYDKNVDSKLVFPNRIEVHPVSGAETAAIGQNVIGGIIDELNYMAVIAKSKQSVDAGNYDQAVALYNSIARRRKSRFMEKGKLPGILCLVSSKRYPGQFTDTKELEAKEDPTIYVYDKRVWELKPDAYGTERFRVFIGDMSRKPRILLDKEEVPEEDINLVIEVPVEYQAEFTKDIINSLREIAGVSTLARHPFMLEVQKVDAAFVLRPSVFSSSSTDFVSNRITLLKGAFYKPDLPRFVHIDLAKSGDSAGLCVGCVDDFVSLKQKGLSQEEAFMPHFHIDGILEVKPPKNAEILFYKVREVVIALRNMGLNIRWVTFDTFQSTDSIQLLRQQGFTTGETSVDVVPCRPYDFLKSAIYDGRITIPKNDHTKREILMLERDAKTGKVDHPPNGSKDTADALAGVVYGLTIRREIWGMFGIPLVMIPSSITTVPDRLEEKNARLAAAVS